jgi:hypothetical protein
MFFLALRVLSGHQDRSQVVTDAMKQLEAKIARAAVVQQSSVN